MQRIVETATKRLQVTGIIRINVVSIEIYPLTIKSFEAHVVRQIHSQRPNNRKRTSELGEHREWSRIRAPDPKPQEPMVSQDLLYLPDFPLTS
jgi:hypothetical protein